MDSGEMLSHETYTIDSIAHDFLYGDDDLHPHDKTVPLAQLTAPFTSESTPGFFQEDIDSNIVISSPW